MSELTTTQEQKQARNKKNLLRALNILFYIVMAVIFIVIIANIIYKFVAKDTFGFFGYRAKVVITKSMSFVYDSDSQREFLAEHTDRIMVDDLIITKEVDDDDQLNVYDIVTFKDDNGYTIVHRLVEIRETENGTVYVTRGDANSGIDYPNKTREQITGKLVKNCGQGAGKIIKFLQSLYGTIALLGIALIAFTTTLILEVMKEKENKKLAALQAQAEAEQLTAQEKDTTQQDQD